MALMDILSSILKPAADYGAYVGESGATLGRLLTNKSFRKAVSGQKLTQDDVAKIAKMKPVFKKDLATDPAKIAQQGLKAGAGAASYAIPVGGSLAGMAAKGALGGGLYGYSQDQNIAKSALGGAAGGVIAGKALPALGKGIKNVFAKKSIEEGAEQAEKTGIIQKTIKGLSLKGVRPSPSQQANYFKITKEPMEEVATRYGFHGVGPEQVNKTIKPLQQSFDDIAKSTNLTVNKSNLLSKFSAASAELKNSGVPNLIKAGNDLDNISTILADKFKSKVVTAADITAQRKLFDKAIKKFATDQGQKSTNQLAREILQESVQDAATGLTDDAGRGLQEMGKELQKLYLFKDIATKQAGLGKGSQVINFTKLLSAIAGGGVAGGPGAIAGVGLTAALNTPKATSLAIKGLQKLQGSGGQVVSNVAKQAGRQYPTELAAMLGRTFGAASAGQQPQAVEQTQQTQTTDSQGRQLSPEGQWVFDQQTNDWIPNMEHPMAQQQGGVDQGMGGQPTREQIAQLMLQDLQNNGGKNISKLKAYADFALGEEVKTEKLTEAQVARQESQQLAANALNDLATKNIKTGQIGGRLTSAAAPLGLADQDTLEFQTTLAALKASIAKARAGTSFTPNEEKLLNKYTPTETDSRQQLETKLNNLVKMFGSPQSSTGIAQQLMGQ